MFAVEPFLGEVLRRRLICLSENLILGSLLTFGDFLCGVFFDEARYLTLSTELNMLAFSGYLPPRPAVRGLLFNLLGLANFCCLIAS